MIFIYLFSFACLLLSIDFFLQIYAESNGKERDFQTKVIIAKIYAEYNNYGSYSSEQKTSYPEKKTHYSDVHLTENQKNNKSNKQKTSFSQRKNTSQNFNADLTQEKKTAKVMNKKLLFLSQKIRIKEKHILIYILQKKVINKLMIIGGLTLAIQVLMNHLQLQTMEIHIGVTV